EALRTWRQEQETVTQLQAVVIPQDITDRTQTLTAQIWETAQAIANERLAKEREALAHKEALLIGENDEMQKVVATLEN
ncbi:DNA-binding protein, partial [Salmonella enterica]|uniref:DNA-binding protein n=1 Tax=Salmonella enterica TaxID=28901 RepID=UPI0015C7FDF1